MIKSMGVVSLGMVTPSLSKAEKLVEPYKTKKQNISTDILVAGGYRDIGPSTRQDSTKRF